VEAWLMASPHFKLVKIVEGGNMMKVKHTGQHAQFLRSGASRRVATKVRSFI
jgi:hypothetical protein